MIIKMLTSGPFETNCYILGCNRTHKGVIIDPAIDTEKLLQIIDNLNLDIIYILLTHGHFDHCSGLGALKDVFSNTPIAIHPDDIPLISTAKQQAGLYGFRIPAVPIPDTFIQQDDEFKFGDETLKALHTPGHTPGGICFYDSSHLFSGDTLFQRSIGRTDLPGGNFQQLISSIKNKLFKLDENIIVYPGHGDKTTIGEEHQFNPYTE